MILGYGDFGRSFVTTSLSTKRPSRTRRGQRDRLWVAQKGKCWWCGRFCMRMGNGGIPTQFTLDHVIPLSHGGTNHWMNLVGSCHSCNNKRNRVWEKLEMIKILVTVEKKDERVESICG